MRYSKLFSMRQEADEYASLTYVSTRRNEIENSTNRKPTRSTGLEVLIYEEDSPELYCSNC